MSEAAERLGFPGITDMHSPLEPPFGWNKMQFTIGADGTRQSSFRAYLPTDLIRARASRLHICTRAVGTKILFSSEGKGGTKADAIVIQTVDGKIKRTVSVRREIVLASGALFTPQLLLLRFVNRWVMCRVSLTKIQWSRATLASPRNGH
jgi:choline dehydrogenase-like flavoprotein